MEWNENWKKKRMGKSDQSSERATPVQANKPNETAAFVSHVITSLGTLEHINPKLMEGLPSGDLMFLQDLYRRANETGHSRLAVTCPHCQGDFEVETSPVGES